MFCLNRTLLAYQINRHQKFSSTVSQVVKICYVALMRYFIVTYEAQNTKAIANVILRRVTFEATHKKERNNIKTNEKKKENNKIRFHNSERTSIIHGKTNRSNS